MLALTFIDRWINALSVKAAQTTAQRDLSVHFPATVPGFIWHFLKPLQSPLRLMLVIYFFAKLLELCEPIFIGQIVGTLADKEFSYERLAWLAGIYIVFSQVLARCLFITGWKIETVFYPLFTNHIRAELGSYVKRHSYRFFQDDFAGRLSGKVLEMPQAIMMTVLDLCTAFFFTLIALAFTLVLLWNLHWTYGLIATSYGFIFCYTIFVKSPQLQALAQNVAKSRNVLRGHFIDSISNILLVKTFARERHEQIRLQHHLDNVTRQDQTENGVFWTLGKWQHFNNAWLQILTVLMSAYGWREGWFDITTVATALPMVVVMAGSAWWLLHISGMFFTRLGEIREGIADLNKPIEIQDRTSATALTIAQPAIEFRNVKFGYPGRPVLEDFSLTIPAFQKVGLVGPSGAGKSTLVQLLMRLHDIQGGEILIDGQSIQDVTQTSLREQIAFIPQSSDLLHRTIEDNLRYGNLDASEEEIVRAAKLAHAHEFIVNLKDKYGNEGYQSIVGERGVKLSGGQRQRIAIARAALKNAPILVLDEATSALDSESEKLIQQSLHDLMKGRTVLVIAHRLSTIAHLDRLLIIEDGRIIEDGSHAELIRKNGLYARLWGLQSAGFLGEA